MGFFTVSPPDAGPTAKLGFDSIRIFIRGTLHLHLKRFDIVAVQSWKWEGNYSIEITFKGGALVLTEYTDEGTWKSILKLIEENL